MLEQTGRGGLSCSNPEVPAFPVMVRKTGRVSQQRTVGAVYYLGREASAGPAAQPVQSSQRGRQAPPPEASSCLGPAPQRRLIPTAHLRTDGG